MAEIELQQAFLKKYIISKLHFQQVGALWRCADRFLMERAEVMRGASLGLFPVGWGITPSEAYEKWQHYALEKWLESDEADFIGRARKSDTARLKWASGKWRCAGGWSDLRFIIQAEGATPLEAYQRWQEKSRTDYLGVLVEQPWPDPSISSGRRLAVGFVSIVAGVLLILWAVIAGTSASIDQHTNNQSARGRDSTP